MKNKNLMNLIIIVGVFLVSIGGFFAFESLTDNGALKNQVLTHLEAVAFSKAERVGAFLEERKNDLEFLSSDEGIIKIFESNELDKNSEEKLRIFYETNRYLSLVLIDMRGKVLWSSNKEATGTILQEGGESKLEEIYSKVQNDFGVGIFDPGYYSEDEELSIYVTMPVLVDSIGVAGKKKMIGIIALQIDNSQIEERVVSDVGLSNAKIYLVNKKGVPTTNLIGKDGKQIIELDSELVSDCFKDYNNYYFSRRGEQVDEVEKSRIYQGYLGEEVFGAHQYILQTGWCVVVELDKDNLMEENK